MSSIIIALYFSLSAYLVCILGDYLKSIVIQLAVMFALDGFCVALITYFTPIKFYIAVGILFGTILKIIIFLLFQKYNK
jgi:hypothetical protein